MLTKNVLKSFSFEAHDYLIIKAVFEKIILYICASQFSVAIIKIYETGKFVKPRGLLAPEIQEHGH